MSTTATVTATLVDPSQTSLLGNAFVRFRLRNFQGFVPVVSGTSVICETQLDALPSPAGSISQVITCNTAISPSNTFWTIEFWNQGRILSSGNYIINGATSLNTASTISNTPAPQGPSAIVFENNGAMNSSQTLLNLESTDSSVVITDKGAGTINLQSTSVGFSTAGSGFFLGPGILGPVPIVDAGAGETIVTSNNEVRVIQFTLNASYTIRQIATDITTNAASATVSFGIYSAAGGKLIDSGAITATNIGVQIVTLASPVVLAAGIYYFAQSASNNTVKVPGGGTGLASAVIATLNAVNPYYALAANPVSGGILPATLGTLTALSAGTSVGVALPVFMV